MKLYHGTNIDFFEIDFKKCKPNKDFGCGFYLTDIKQQAVDMAIRRAKFEDKGSPVVQEYEFDESLLTSDELRVGTELAISLQEKIMKQYNNEIEFIINCDVEKIVSLLQEDYGMTILDAFDTIYNSRIYKKLIDTETGLYIQSPLYIYEYLKEEIGEPKMAITTTT